jgi:hypothetical protein
MISFAIMIGNGISEVVGWKVLYGMSLGVTTLALIILAGEVCAKLQKDRV